MRTEKEIWKAERRSPDDPNSWEWRITTVSATVPEVTSKIWRIIADNLNETNAQLIVSLHNK